MTDNSEPTIEELQAQVLELQKRNEDNATKIEDLESKNAKLTQDLGNSRSLNAKLMRNLPAGGEERNEEEDKKETPEDFLDSFIKPAVEKLGKR